MNVEKIEFPAEEYWDAAVEAIRFPADLNDRRIMCSISRIALVDYYRTEDTKDNALGLFKEHRKAINNLATRLLNEGRFNEKGEIFIMFEDVAHYQLNE